MKSKTEKWLNDEAQRSENAKLNRFTVEEPVVVDPVAEAEERHRTLMESAEAPEWARPAKNDAYVTPPVTREEITAKLAELDKEQTQAAKALADVQEKQRQALNDQLAAQKLAEEQMTTAEAAALPGRLADVLKQVREYVNPSPKIAPVDTTLADDPIKRGQDALDRALRRSRGEDVPEPEYVAAIVTTLPDETAQQAALRQRVAPALLAAAERQAELMVWSKKAGDALADLHIGRGEDDVPTVNALMRGIPPTEANIASVRALVRVVSSTMEVYAVMAKTLERDTADLETIIQGASRRGSMTSQGDHSTAYYLLERDLVGALTRLATVTPDSVQGLWARAKDITRRLDTLAALRVAHAGEVHAPIVWESKQGILDDVRRAEDMTRRGGPGKQRTALTSDPISDLRRS